MKEARIAAPGHEFKFKKTKKTNPYFDVDA